MRSLLRRLVIASTFGLCSYSLAISEDWQQWRGPTNDGHSADTNVVKDWSLDTNVKWKTPLPGRGGSTPIIVNGRIYLTSGDKGDLVAMGLSGESGEVLWKTRVTSGDQPARGDEGNSASASPVCDGEHVWVFFSNGVLACLTIDGDEVWKFDVGERFGRLDIQFGLTSTPVLDGDHLYLQLIHGAMRRGDNTRTGQVIKLEKKTGKTVWVNDRVTNADFECKHSYASPFLHRGEEGEFLVVHGADCITAHDLSTGKELWRFGELNGPTRWNAKQNDPTFRFVASPLITRGRVIVPTAKEGPLVSLKLDQLKGDSSANAQAVAWVSPRTPDVSIPLAVDKYIYLLQKDGRLQCVEWDTGKEVYLQRVHSSQHRTSPIYADGYLYMASSDGTVSVVKAGPEFELVSSVNVGAPVTASPVISDGTLFIRSFDAIYAIR
ncbi:PQQ-binding-like beta-propeller repeat protein [Pirellulaceae bacterium SH449]